MKLISAPSAARTTQPTLFLAGTIDQGKSHDWQADLITAVSDLPITIYNPRRAQWNPQWSNLAHKIHPQLRAQIRWELSHLEKADLIALWLEETSLSPISLLELGLHKHSGKLIVGCPKGFYRAANVWVTAQFYKVPVYADWKSFKAAVVKNAQSLISLSNTKASAPKAL